MRKSIRNSAIATFVVGGFALTLATPAEAVETRNFAVAVYSGGQLRGQVYGVVNWTNGYGFNIPHAFLRDDSCDGYTVHFELYMNSNWPGGVRENRSGCNTTKIFNDIAASSQYTSIRYVRIKVCRNEWVDTCTTKYYYNPYVRV
ncbi:hypothetical protein ACIGMX_34385 [Streptomyces aquilus]|uniref:hypothetical protein n=1 Tax=Streptomyces aquilus TaxID=2548456 RepID=UPI0037CF553F